MYNKIGDSMEYLCFVNGRNQDEIVTIIEGEIFTIDRATTNYINSDTIRKKYKKKFAEFQRKYPHAGNGAVRIFGDSVYSENGQRVLYQKHKIAFKHIITDKPFLRYIAQKDLNGQKKDRIIYDTYILNGIAYYDLEITRINQFLSMLKKDDRKETGLTGGGRRYYLFMRILLNRYEEYRKKYNKPSIDDIWANHLKKLEDNSLALQRVQDEIMLLEPPTPADTVIVDTQEIDEDYYRLGEEPVFEDPIYEFFTGDYFERYYGDTFKDESLMVITDLSRTSELSKQNAVMEASEICYNGSITGVELTRFNQSAHEALGGANTVIIYSEVDSRNLRAIIITALENKSNIVFISDDAELLNNYTKKFKNIVPILDTDDDHKHMKKELVAYFISHYQEKKGYSKK